MSDDQSEEKTEDPSFQKLKKARERGDIARSQAFVQVVASIGGLASLWLAKDAVGERLRAVTTELMRQDDVGQASIIFLVRDTVVLMSLPTIAGALAAVLFANFLTNRGLMFSLEKIKPNLQHLSFSSYRERSFSKHGMAMLIEISIIATLLFVTLYLIVLYFAADYFRLFACGLSCGLSFVTLVGGIYITIGLFIAFAVALADLKIQERLYQEKQKSTKTEAKQEQKEEMGEPTIRQERKSQHQQAAGAASPEDKASRTSFVLHASDAFAVAVGYVNLDGQERFFTVEGGIASGALKLIGAAESYGKPLLSAPRDVAAKLVRYGDEREITDPDLRAMLLQLIQQARREAEGR